MVDGQVGVSTAIPFVHRATLVHLTLDTSCRLPTASKVIFTPPVNMTLDFSQNTCSNL